MYHGTDDQSNEQKNEKIIEKLTTKKLSQLILFYYTTMMTAPEKQISKSNTWNNLRKKLKVLGWTSALSLLITLNSCGPADLNVKKAADKFQEKTEQVGKLKKKLKNKEEDLKELQEDIKETQEDITDAEKEAAEAKKQLQKESGNL